MLNQHENEILERLGAAIEKMSEEQRDKLLAWAEGVAFATEQKAV